MSQKISFNPSPTAVNVPAPANPGLKNVPEHLLPMDSFGDMGLNQKKLLARQFPQFFRNVSISGNDNWTNRVMPALTKRAYAQFVTRFVWKGLPDDLDGMQIERMLYHRGLLGFCQTEQGEFLMLPAKLMTNNATGQAINFMGKWKEASLVPFNGVGTDRDNRAAKGKMLMLAMDTVRTVRNGVPFVSSYAEGKEVQKNSMVLLTDYTQYISENTDPQYLYDIVFLDGLKEALQLIRTAGLNSTGATWIRVKNQAEGDLVEETFRVMDKKIINGQRYFSVTSTTELQEGSAKSTAQITEFWQHYQAVDNLRMSTIGLDNDGVIQKNQYQNIAELAVDMQANNPILLDAWMQRLKFCTIVNAIWGRNITCEPSMMAQPAGNTGGESESSDEGAEGSMEATNETH